MYGVREFAAIISPPQATILAVGAGMRRPVETADGGVAFTTQMTVTLSCDHRVVDGALGAEVLRELKAILEEPLRALLRSEEHTSELQSLMRISYAVFCLKKKNKYNNTTKTSAHEKK